MVDWIGVLYCIRGITIHNFVSAIIRFLGFILRLVGVYEEEGLEHRVTTTTTLYTSSSRVGKVFSLKTALGET